MNEAIEVKVRVSNEEQKYAKKFLHYGKLAMSHEDEELKQMVEGTVSEFKGGVDDVDVILKMKW